MDENRNHLWARILVEELVRSGVREVCVAPGSRSTALVFAADRQEGLNVRVFLDERSAAFFALGLARVTGVPAVVITTSGTAVANLLPAVVEASQSEVPLILLTADRPHRLRDADANQAIRQPGIFGSYTRESWDLPLPVAEVTALVHLRSVGCRAVASALGPPAGPVHLNAPFEKPLEPVEVAGDVPSSLADHPVLHGRRDAPWTRVGTRLPELVEPEFDLLVDRITEAERPLMIVGAVPTSVPDGPRFLRFAGQAGMPVLGDPLSGVRFGPAHGAVRTAHHDLFLRDAGVREALRPDLLLRIGPAPTSSALLRWIDELEIDQIVIDPGGRWKDHVGGATHYVQASPGEVLTRAGKRVTPAHVDWRRRWAAVDAAANTAIREAPGPMHEGHLARAVADRVEDGAPFFLSSSMPIRDVDAYAAGFEDRRPLVHGNRGASGIDGIVSTTLGVAAAAGRRAVGLIGDLAFLHDANGLLATREDDAEVLFVVVNNDGGGIFHMLPVREHEPAFTRYFATPHGLDLSKLSALYGLPHRTVELGDDLGEVLDAEFGASGSRVLEIRTDRERNRVGHVATAAAVARAARSALDLPDVGPV